MNNNNLISPFKNEQTESHIKHEDIVEILATLKNDMVLELGEPFTENTERWATISELEEELKEAKNAFENPLKNKTYENQKENDTPHSEWIVGITTQKINKFHSKTITWHATKYDNGVLKLQRYTTDPRGNPVGSSGISIDKYPADSTEKDHGKLLITYNRVPGKSSTIFEAGFKTN